MVFTKILLATDGSENASRAADAAISLAKGLSLPSITIIHIVTDPPSESRMVQVKFDVHSLLEEESRKIASETLARCDAAGIAYTLKVAIGDPAQEILAHVQKDQTDLVVIGSRGLGTPERGADGECQPEDRPSCPVPGPDRKVRALNRIFSGPGGKRWTIRALLQEGVLIAGSC